MTKSGTSDNKLQGATLKIEHNFSAFENNLPFWHNNSPFKPGTKFPDKQMKERSNINLTIKELCSNSLSSILTEIMRSYPIVDPFTQRRVQTIAAELPLWSTTLKTWRQLMSSCIVGVEVNGVKRDDLFNCLEDAIYDILTNKFTCCDRADVVYLDDDGQPLIKVYSDKNIVIHRTRSDDRVVTITNVENMDGQQRLETISYLPDGSIYRNLYSYANNIVGKQLIQPQFIDIGTKAVFRTNGACSNTFGMPELYDAYSAINLAIRAWIVYSALLEHKKNVSVIAPDSALVSDSDTGIVSLIAGSAITYNDKNPETMQHNHDVRYVVPELNLKEAEDALNFALKQVSLYSQLSDVLLGFRTLSGNDSGRAIIANSISTTVAATGYLKQLTKELKEIVVNIEHLYNREVDVDDVKILTLSPDEVITSLVNSLNDNKEEEITIDKE